jgi:hypothetical protein
LATLPERVCQLTALQKVDVWQDELISFAKSFGQLTALQTIAESVDCSRSFGELAVLKSQHLILLGGCSG